LGQLRTGIDAALARSWRRDRRLQAEREVERIFAMSPALLAVAGFDGYLKRFNPAFEVFGYSRDELLSRPWVEFAHPDDRERMARSAEQLGRGVDVVELVNRVVCRDGSVRWVQWSTRVVPEEGLFYAAGRDVTETRRAAEEQAALRRIATLVARETAPDEVLAAVGREVGEVLGLESTHLGRYDAPGAVISVAQWGAQAGVPIGARFPLDGDSVSARVLQTGQPARMDGYDDASGAIATTIRELGIRYAIGVPIVVEGQPWGVMIATSKAAPFAAETESRLEHFTELVATAIANADARAEAKRLADEQAALRRVATLVAGGAPPSAVFDAVTRELSAVLDASAVSLARHHGDTLAIVATRGTPSVEVGDEFPLGGTNVASEVMRTGRIARLDDYAEATGAIGDASRRAGVRSVVGVPVVVNGRTWGVLAAVWGHRVSPPEEIEKRMASFAELLDTAIANADSRDQLAASRARLLAAGDDARRRLVRDLHDGAQQRLVHAVITLKLAQRAVNVDRGDTQAHLSEALVTAERAMAELRELAHGILPSVLTHGGLRAGVGAFVSRLDLVVDVDVLSDRLPQDIEASAYFIVAEALTNVVKHAQATRAAVRAAIEEQVLVLEVRDDGVGGADREGHGLMGIADRVDALGGRLTIQSARGDGTTLVARLPLPVGRAPLP
jgi:PAS domain S-box-containing protein